MMPVLTPFIASGATALGGFASSSLFGYLRNKFVGAPQLPVDFNSPEYLARLRTDKEQEFLQHNMQNPHMAASPSMYRDIDRYVDSRNYMQAQQINAQYDPRLRSQFNYQQMQDAMNADFMNKGQALVGYGVNQGMGYLNQGFNAVREAFKKKPPLTAWQRFRNSLLTSKFRDSAKIQATMGAGIFAA